MPAPGEGPVLEFEQLIKVFFRGAQTKADLLATLAATREWSGDQLGASAGLPKAYLGGMGPFPERLPWLVLIGQFLADFYLMVEHWADWASATVKGWPDDLATAQPDWKALEMLETITSAASDEPERRTGAGQGMRRPLIARAMTSRWISEVPSRIGVDLACRGATLSTGYSRV